MFSFQIFDTDNKILRRPEDEEEDKINDETDLDLMGVDEAIIHSIEKCGKNEQLEHVWIFGLTLKGPSAFQS